MSFYVTLPSNSSMDIYPNNTQSEFTILLKEKIKIESGYEVALVELIHGDSYFTEVGYINVTNPYYLHFSNSIGENEVRSQYLHIKLYILPHDNVKSFFDRTSKIIMKKLLQEEYNARYYHYINILQKQTFVFYHKNVRYQLPTKPYDSKYRTNEVINEITNFLNDYKIILSYNENTQLLEMTMPYSLQFTGHILDIMNLSSDFYTMLNNKVKIYSYALEISSNIFVITDLINEQFVGDGLLPLLKTISIPNSSKEFSSIIKSPHYVPINKTLIDRIFIKLEDSSGDRIRFFSNFNKVIAKLHFRKMSKNISGFYVSLPSKLSSFPNNKSNYTTNLRHQLVLDSNYEVALIDFTYNEFIKIELGYIKFTNPNEKSDTISILINGYESEPFSSFINRINQDISNICTNNNHIKFETNQKNKVLLIVPDAHNVTFEGTLLKQVFGFTNYDENIQLYTNYEFNNVYNQLNILNVMFIYTDIIEDQYVGNVKAPLLRSVVTKKKFNQPVSHVFEFPHYVNVNKTSISSINIDIRDTLGKEINFSGNNSSVICTLHFRIKNESI